MARLRLLTLVIRSTLAIATIATIATSLNCHLRRSWCVPRIASIRDFSPAPTYNANTIE
jgi:hypothetical protein